MTQETERAGEVDRPGFWPVLRVLRPEQWSKNALLAVPLVMAHQIEDPSGWRSVLVAILAFSAVSSAGYVFNDLVDRAADRRHPDKRHRPLASGQVSTTQAVTLMVALFATGFLVAWFALPAAFVRLLIAYLALSMTYSYSLKRVMLLDVMALAAMYTLRILAGGASVDVPVSRWLLVFSMFIFLSLAFAKRYEELQLMRSMDRDAPAGRGYQIADESLVSTIGVASGVVSALVLCLYVSSDTVAALYRRPDVLWLLGPIMLYWILRIWFVARRGRLTSDPILFALRDRASYAVAFTIALVLVAAAY